MALRFRDCLVSSDRPLYGGRAGQAAALLVAVLAGIATVGSRAGALTSVDCDTTDDFCTGDPCETSDSIVITVAACVLDFSPRKLVIANKVFVPNDGTLSLTAATIEVRGKIDGKHTKSASGDGADITLTAGGDILVRVRIDAAGRNSVGTIVLDAGGDIDLEHQLRARVRGSGATATGGTVSVEAGGTLRSTRRGRIDVRGRRNNTAGGQATLRGGSGVTLVGRVDARGKPGGSVAVESSGGDVNVQEEIRVEGLPAGQVALDAAGDLTIGGRRGKIQADGGSAVISLEAGGTATIGTTLHAKGDNVLGLPGGTVAVVARTVNAERFLCRGGPTGGAVDLQSTVGDVSISRLIDVRGRDAGGTVRVDSAGDLSVAEVIADSTITGGEIRLSAAGNAVLGTTGASDFRADGDFAGGVIEAVAGGDLTAKGDYRAAVGGCIGLSAGGTLDTTLASFDVPLTASCP